jgi:hypothetical protein
MPLEEIFTSWNVQGGNNPDGSEFTTLLAGSSQLNANNYLFNIDYSTAYKVYRFNNYINTYRYLRFGDQRHRDKLITIQYIEYYIKWIYSNGRELKYE